MSTVKKLASRFATEEDGAGLIEYALLCALIALGSVVAMTALGVSISGLFGRVGTRLDGTSPP